MHTSAQTLLIQASGEVLQNEEKKNQYPIRHRTTSYALRSFCASPGPGRGTPVSAGGG